jgi:hypothetical protein
MHIATISLALGCASAAPQPTARPEFGRAASMNVDLPGHRLVAEGVSLPDAPELRPYLGKVPLAYLSQTTDVDRRDPSYELAVFDDGSVFFEGGCMLGALSSRKMSADERERFVRLLQNDCAEAAQGSVSCSHGTALAVTCRAREALHRGHDECDARSASGRRLKDFATLVLQSSGAIVWLGVDAKGECALAPGNRSISGQIRKTVTPAYWKRYEPKSSESGR